MALTTFGTAHVFGIDGTVTNATVQSFNVTEDFQNRTNTLDESGNEIERRMDDLMSSGDITIKIQSTFTIPNAGDLITYDAIEYEIITVGQAKTNDDYVIITLSIKTSEHVDLSP